MNELIGRITALVHEFGLDVDGDLIYAVDTRMHTIESIYINLAAICRESNNSDKIVHDEDKNDDIHTISSPSVCKKLFNMMDDGLIVLIGKNISPMKDCKNEEPNPSTNSKSCYSFNIMGDSSIDYKPVFDAFHNILVSMQKCTGCNDYANNKILLNRDEGVILIDNDASRYSKMCVFIMNSILTWFNLYKDEDDIKEFVEQFTPKDGEDETALYRLFVQKYATTLGNKCIATFVLKMHCS